MNDYNFSLKKIFVCFKKKSSGFTEQFFLHFIVFVEIYQKQIYVFFVYVTNYYDLDMYCTYLSQVIYKLYNNTRSPANSETLRTDIYGASLSVLNSKELRNHATVIITGDNSSFDLFYPAWMFTSSCIYSSITLVHTILTHLIV